MDSHPVCNYCDYEFDDDETWHYGLISTGDCDVSNVECPSCKKKIYIECCHIIKFKTIKEQDVL
jgi:hypothetical protein